MNKAWVVPSIPLKRNEGKGARKKKAGEFFPGPLNEVLKIRKYNGTRARACGDWQSRGPS